MHHVYSTRRSHFLHWAPEQLIALLHAVSHSHPDAVSSGVWYHHVWFDAVHCYNRTTRPFVICCCTMLLTRTPAHASDTRTCF